jgi:fluoroquinolone transport system permease protein
MTWLDIARGLVITDVKHIVRDRFVMCVLAYSLVLAAAVRFGVPPLTTTLSGRYGIDLVPYYGLISSFVALTIGSSMIGLVLGFLLLDARETRVLDALSVTPLTFDRFVVYRVAMPMVVAAGISTLALATFADNKVQAFAVLKLVSGVSMLPMAAYFIEGPLHYLFGVFPPFWIFKAWWVAVDGGSTWWMYALVGVLTNLVLLGWMKSRFERVVHRGKASVVRATPSPAPASS